MKLIIELDDDIAKGIRGENECEVEPREIVRSFQATIADAIAQSKPYDDSGDCISRSELMKAIGTMVEAEMPIDEKWALGLKHSLKVIDNAPTVEPFTQLEKEEIADAITYLLDAELLEENGYTEEVIKALKSALKKVGGAE